MSSNIKTFIAFLAFFALISVFSFFDIFHGVRSASFFESAKSLPPLPDDADGDGLTDSEESYWNTDFLNPDTDGDGFLDGEEVASGHDPRVKSSEDDSLADTVFGTPPPVVEPDLASIVKEPGLASLNITEETLILLAGGINAGDLTRNASQATKDNAINALSFSVVDSFNKIQDSIPLPTIITIDASKENQVKYLNGLAEIIKNNLLNFSQQLDFASSIDRQLPYFLAKSNQFKSSLDTASALPVPVNWVDIHKNILSFLGRLSLIYGQIAKYETDVLAAAAALQEINYLSLELKSLIKSIQIKISSENIVLDNNFYQVLELLYKD